MTYRLLPLLVLLGCSSSSSSTDGGSNGDLAVRTSSSSCANIPATTADGKTHEQSCALGDDAARFLRAAPYSKAVIEVAAVAGTTPSAAALSHLSSVITTVCDKPGGVTMVNGNMSIAAPGHALSVQDVIALEDANRTQYSHDDTAVFFYLVVSDPSTLDTSDAKVLGLAYRPSAMVVFQGSIDSVSGGIGQPSADTVETAVVAHEYGHVMGLVNIADPMVTPHQDTANGAHCNNKSCLMYYLNNSSAGLAGNLLSGGSVADFDDNCKADLMNVRNGN